MGNSKEFGALAGGCENAKTIWRPGILAKVDKWTWSASVRDRLLPG